MPAVLEEEPMKDLSLEVRSAAQTLESVLPETLEEAERLVACIEREVHRQTAGGVRNLTVEVGPEGVLLRGRCSTYYCKQLAQHAVMGLHHGRPLTNEIEVA